ncbi:VanZ family protein [Metabacillus idriensis]|uniref:VanZ family protein n=1 Tax=Metabacillus idriensis TaxID=324768 RepID=UPI00174B40C3|nr:VanZ family protein [Metabacillus idriensis]
MEKIYWISLAVSQSLFFLLLPIWLSLTEYLHPIVTIVVWFCLTAIIVFSVFLSFKKVMIVPYELVYGCLILYTVSLLILLFIRPEAQNNSYNLVPFETIGYYFSGQVSLIIAFYNLAANIGLFVPYGFLMKIKAMPKQSAFLVAFFVISIIETAQYLTGRGSLDVDDLILNLLGVFTGYAVYPIFEKTVSIKKSGTARLAPTDRKESGGKVRV